MTVRDRTTGAAALGAAAFIVAGASAPPAEAAYVVTLEQEGPNVVATGSGTIDLASLTLISPLPNVESAINPSEPEIVTGAQGDIDIYGLITPPTAFGSEGMVFASAGRGDLVGASADALAVPAGYGSGGFLSGSATWDDATFATLGATPGVYVWTWGSGANADSFTLDALVPEPSTWALLAVGFLSLAGLGLRAQTASASAGGPLQSVGAWRGSRPARFPG